VAQFFPTGSVKITLRGTIFPYQECNKQINAGAGVQRTHELI